MNNQLIIHASFGQGHKQAAISLEEYLKIQCFDLLDFTHPIIKKFYAQSYILITQNTPFLWKLLFFAVKNPLMKYLLTIFHDLIFYSFFQYLRKNKINHVITTHFFPIQILTSKKEFDSIKITTVVTDLHVHPLWIDKRVNHYYVALPETEKDLIRFNVKKEQITTGYFPLRQGFLNPVNPGTIRKQFNLDKKPCLLFVSSNRGQHPFLLSLINDLIKDFNLIIITGNNNRLRQKLISLNSRSIVQFPFYEKMWELLEISNVMITKPGGLTICEAITKKMPFIFTHYIPGQEKENMELLINYKIAHFALTAAECKKAIYDFYLRYNEIQSHYPLSLSHIQKVLSP